MAETEKDPLKETFRPNTDAGLDAEIDRALGDLSLEQLYGSETTQATPPDEPRGTRTGKVVRIGKDEVYIDFGGKAQGVAPLLDFVDGVLIGQEVEVEVERYDASEGMLIVHKKGAVQQTVNWETLEVGQVVEALVTGTNKGGLELEVKGMRAFMPAGQVELWHVPDFSQYVGTRLTAEVTTFDREKKNLVLSRRNLLEREREEQRKKTLEELAEGQIRRGVVRNVMDFGAFVDLGGVDGLLHVSEMTFKRGRQNANDFVKIGDVVDVKVLKIDPETKKISLSLKQALGADPWESAETKCAPGTQVTGRVTRVESFGAFIEIEEGVEGLLPVSEMSWQRIRHPSDVVKEGDTIKLVVLKIDPAERKMSFSLKQAGPDPWATVKERYATDMVTKGTVTRVVDFGAFVELEPGLEGLVHISELADHRVRSAGDVVKPGDSVEVRVLDIDQDARRISLSIKRAKEGAAPAPARPAAAPALSPKELAKKQKRQPQLRGGLDFKY